MPSNSDISPTHEPGCATVATCTPAFSIRNAPSRSTYRASTGCPSTSNPSPVGEMPPGEFLGEREQLVHRRSIACGRLTPVSGDSSDRANRRMPIGAALLHIQSWLTGRDDEFTKWCDEFHHFEALEAPGFLACRRFEVVPGYAYAAADGAGYLTVYQLEDATAVDSEAHQAVVAAMTPPPPGLMDDVSFTTTVYTERFPLGGWMTPTGEVAGGDEPIGAAILHVMMDVDPAWDDELNAWYADEHLPRLLEVPGMLAARRFVDAHWASSPFSHGGGDARSPTGATSTWRPTSWSTPTSSQRPSTRARRR